MPVIHAACSLLLSSALAQQYTVRELAPVAVTPAAARFEPGTRATAIATNGAAGGSSVTDTDSRNVHAVRWSPAGAATDLGVLPGDVHSQVLAGNAAGDLVGGSFKLNALVTHGVLWKADGTRVALGNIEPVDVNASRVVAANVYAAGVVPGGTRAVRWSAGRATTLPVLPGGLSARAAAINAQGWIVGSGFMPDRINSHACVWVANGIPIDLGTLGGNSSFARAIDGRTVVGVADLGDGTPHACKWMLSNTGTLQATEDLGMIAGKPGSAAEAIAADGRIGGNCGDAAVLFTGGGAVVDLNTQIAPGSGWQLTHVTGFGEGGRIVGRGRLNGIPRGFVLEPAP